MVAARARFGLLGAVEAFIGGLLLNDTTPDDVAVVERRWSR